MFTLSHTLIALLTLAQAKEPDRQLQAIKEKADAVGKAVLAGDYGNVVDLTFPKVAELMGGRGKMVEIMRSGTAEMKAQGITFHAITFDAPREVVRAGGELYAIVPEVVIMKVPGGRLRQKSYLIAVSSDGGKTWTFIDGAGPVEKQLKDLLPNFPKELTLPERQKPVFEKDP